MNAKEFFYDQSFQDYPKPPSWIKKQYQKIMYWLALQIDKALTNANRGTDDTGPR